MIERVNSLVAKTSLFYDTQERLGRSPFMNILSKTITTYMFLINLNP
jgi:hypothetical protein